VRGPAKHLTKGVAIYGAGDAAVTIVNFLLLPIYVKSGFLTAADFGALALIQSLEAYAKVVNRWGLDGAFMRFYNERAEGLPRQRMTSTILGFMAAANGATLAAALVGAGLMARAIKLDPAYLLALRLMLVNMFVMSFTFVPFHVMRLRNQAATFSAFTLARSTGTILLRIGLIIGLRQGIGGAYLADLLVTMVLVPLMWPWLRPLLTSSLSMAELRTTLRFGLPRLPHGLASQTLDGYPKLLLGQNVAGPQLGVYQNGVTLGTGVAFFKNAFETAFAPFYYATARQPNAKEVFSKMATYGVAVLVLIVAGTIAVARDVILVMLKPEYLDALPVVPLVAVAFGLQGVYQLTSIGLNLTSRTEFYSVSTLSAAGVSVAAGLWLVPHYGVTGAAVTVLVSYATQVGVGTVLARRVYPMQYEAGRLARVVIAGVLSALVALWAVPDMPPMAGLLVRGAVTVLVYVGLLVATGFFRPTERAFLREMIARLRQRGTPTDAS
jgi:O-antigen/teichoic acid export membrane protein